MGLGASIAFPRLVQAQGPCGQIVAACKGAGFVQGGVAGGNGLWLDCVDLVMQGTASRHAGGKPLPKVDPQLVAACRSSDASFAKPKAPPAPEPVVQGAPGPVHSARTSLPNIVFVLTDDLAWNLVPYMPHVLAMQKQGVTFENDFVTDSLCCPSRSSIFTGRFPHDTGIFTNGGKDGGYIGFRDRGHERTTFATALAAAGYRTAMLGKYLNGYEPAMDPVAPGWASWAVGGKAAYREFRYDLNQDGAVFKYGDKPADYLTDVLSARAVRFIKQAGGSPFLIEIATYAPHAPYTPAPRDADALPGARAPRTPAFGAAPDADAAGWLRALPPLSASDTARIDADFRKRAQAVLAVDAMIGELQAAVIAIGQESHTYFVFSSDNGYHMGEHRMMPGKQTPYDTDIRVPLVVTGPGVPAGRTVGQIVENVDLCPTFAELAGASAPGNVDGRSLVPLLHGTDIVEWRTVALVEHHGPHKDPADPDRPARRSGNPPTYEAIRTATSLYVEYADGTREYHDLRADPDELRNTFSALSAADKASLAATLQAIETCHDAKSCWAAALPGRVVTAN